MSPAVRLLLVLALLLPGPPGRAADAGEVTEILGIAWESFWHSTGYPRDIYKWREPIRVKFAGDEVERPKEFALRQLQTVAGIAGIDIAEAASDGAGANLEVEFFASNNLLPANQPCDTNVTARDGTILRVRMRLNGPLVWRCMLHESMHAMGISGHPSGKSILTYFARDGKLSEADELILKTIYSNEVKPGMYPFPALAIVARRLVESVAAGADRSAAEEATQTFLQNTIKQAEAFAAGLGDPPLVLLRSGRATAAGLARGRVQMRFLLGVAYREGQIVAIDRKKSVAWLTDAAAASHTDAQLLLGDAYFRGMGAEQDLIEGYKWCYLAAQKGNLRAKNTQQKMESRLGAEQIAEGRARAAAWSPNPP